MVSVRPAPVHQGDQANTKGMNYSKRLHGFTVVNRGLDRHMLRDDFLSEVDSVLVQTDSLELEKTVLLGDVDNGRTLPKWFPFKVQYQLPAGEQVVRKLVLIVDKGRVVFLLTGHQHDLATIFARYSRLRAERRGVAEEAPVANT